MKKDSRDFLLEIDVQDLPAGYIRGALDSLKGIILKEFEAVHITYGEVFLGGTANLLVCYIKDVLSCQKASVKKIIGPPKRIAFDENGHSTAQALGFAKTQGVSVHNLKIEKTTKGEYVVVEKSESPVDTKDVLQEIIPRAIKGMYFPKTMKWDASSLRFARPIESVLSLFGKDRIKLRIGNVPQKKIDGTLPSKYLEHIKKRYLINPDERKEKIKNLILSENRRLGTDQHIDEELLEEVNFMVTSPKVFAGKFDKKFLVLPQDVLKASMSKYQRIFPVSKKGRILNRFVAVIDGERKDIRKICKNYENILDARLKDSMFFFDEDTKMPFSENIPQLKHLIFQKDLGSMFEKIERLQMLSVFISQRLNLDKTMIDTVHRAAFLSKADLVTHMVGEFPSLQGNIGREYALRTGEKKDVAETIGEQYMPKGMNDSLPKSLAGAILAISERIDNVVGFLGMGVELSSSFDPFGIRRNVQGVIQIVQDKSLRFKIDELIDEASHRYGNKLKIDRVELKEKIIAYVKERIGFMTGNVQPAGLKDAVLEVRCFDIVDIFNRMRELSSISNKRYFLESAKVVERTNNILKGAGKGAIGNVDENLFKEDLERRLWNRYLDSEPTIKELTGKEKYKEATKKYAEAFFKVLHDFFENVLVHDEDVSLRMNRFAIMKKVNMLYTEHIADLAKLPQIVVTKDEG